MFAWETRTKHANIIRILFHVENIKRHEIKIAWEHLGIKDRSNFLRIRSYSNIWKCRGNKHHGKYKEYNELCWNFLLSAYSPAHTNLFLQWLYSGGLSIYQIKSLFLISDIWLKHEFTWNQAKNIWNQAAIAIEFIDFNNALI